MTYFSESDAAQIAKLRSMIAANQLHPGSLASFARERCGHIQEMLRCCAQSDIGWRMFLERRYWSMVDVIEEAKAMVAA